MAVVGSAVQKDRPEGTFELGKYSIRVPWQVTVDSINDGPLIECAKRAKIVVVAWGNNGSLAGRDEDVLNRVIPDIPLYCIGLTKSGQPLHPCMTAYTDKPMRFRD